MGLDAHHSGRRLSLAITVLVVGCQGLMPYRPGDSGPDQAAPVEDAPRDGPGERPIVADLADAGVYPDGDFMVVVVDGGEACVDDPVLWRPSCQRGPSPNSCVIGCGDYTIICQDIKCSCARADGANRNCVDLAGLADCSPASTCFLAITDSCCTNL